MRYGRFLSTYILRIFFWGAGSILAADELPQVPQNATASTASSEAAPPAAFPAVAEENYENIPVMSVEGALQAGPKAYDPQEIFQNEVAVVTDKKLPKKYRHQVIPILVGGDPFNAYFQSLYFGAEYTFYINDSLGFSPLRAMFSKMQPTVLPMRFRSQNISLQTIYPSGFVEAALNYVPFHFKGDLGDFHSVNGEFELSWGAGGIFTENIQNQQGFLLINPATSLAAAWKFHLSSNTGISFQIKQYWYEEKVAVTGSASTFKSQISGQFALNLGFYVFLP